MTRILQIRDSSSGASLFNLLRVNSLSRMAACFVHPPVACGLKFSNCLKASFSQELTKVADNEYKDKVAQLYKWGADLFRGKTEAESILASAREYYERGESEGFSIPELIDYLGVSCPSVLDVAGFRDEEVVRIMTLIADSQ